MNSFAEILLIAIFMSAACALPGNFLVLRRMSMLTDAISHTVLLGIVLAFLAVGSLDSPFLIIGASLMGVLTVWLIELLYQSRLVASDSAIGLIFPLLFSIAVILVTRYAGNVHLDTDCILLGELAFAPFDRLIIHGIDLGAKGLYTGGGQRADDGRQKDHRFKTPCPLPCGNGRRDEHGTHEDNTYGLDGKKDGDRGKEGEEYIQLAPRKSENCGIVRIKSHKF